MTNLSQSGKGVRGRTRVMLIEDQRMLRECLTHLCSMAFGVEVCASFETGDEMLKLNGAAEADLFIIDLNLPDWDGIELALRLRQTYPHTRILIISGDCSCGTVLRAIKADFIDGFYSKSDDLRLLAEAISAVASGKRYFSPAFEAAEKGMQENSSSWTKTLSDKELIVLPLLAVGNANEEIAKNLGTTANTIAAHRRSILNKLNLVSIQDLVHFALSNGFVQTGPDGRLRTVRIK